MTRESSGEPDDDGASGKTTPSSTWPWVVAPVVVLLGAAVVGAVVVGFSDTGCGCQPAYPTLVLEFDHDAGAVEVTHEGGDSVSGEYSTESLTVHVNGERRRAIPLPFVEGDSIEVEGVQPGDVVRVVLTPSGEYANAMVIDSYEVPDR